MALPCEDPDRGDRNPMDMRYVLLSSKGRIGSRTFLRGLTVITAAFMIVQVANTFISPIFGILVYPMVYVYVCLFSKRLHDAGHSGWFYLLFLAGYGIVGSIVSALLMPILSPVAFEMYAQFGSDLSGAMDALTENIQEFERLTALTSLASFLLTTALLGFIAARLPTDLETNRYGPPTSGTPMSNTYS
ncbi:MAG TPA: hypothetical protein DEB52_11900 [Hyphomonas sp.]|nr:hypothetical protein [Hyphomonas sp.]